MGREGILSDDRNSIVAGLRVERALGGGWDIIPHGPHHWLPSSSDFPGSHSCVSCSSALTKSKYFVTKKNIHVEAGIGQVLMVLP